MRRFGALLAAALLGSAPAMAARAGCGTVVIPTGVGIGDLPQAVTTLHPALLTGSAYEYQMMGLMFRPLLSFRSGLAIDWDLSLASDVEANASDTVFTVTLKPYDWSDGVPVTSDDVLYDWSLIKELGEAYAAYGNGGVPQLISSVVAVDAHHVEFNLTRPVNPEWFEKAGIPQFYALPRHAWGRYTIAEQQTLQSEASFYRVVDGPFRLQDFVLGRYATFVPNRHYGGHQASIKRLVVNFLQGTNPLEALEAGQVDMVSLPFELWNASASLRDVRRVRTPPALAFGVITPNENNPNAPFLAEVPVRQAITRAIDQQRIVSSIFQGQANIEVGEMPASLSDLQAPELRNGQSPLSYDPAAARALLQADGWHAGPDGIRVKNGRRLAFTVLVTAGAEIRLMLLQVAQANLASVGIAMSIKEVEFNQLIARMLGPPAGWDAVFLDYTVQSFPDPLQYFKTGATGNYEHYSNAAMDRLLEKADGEPGRGALYAVDRFAILQQPLIFLPDGHFTILARPGIGGIERFFSPTGAWAPEYLTLTGPMACDGAHA